MNTSNDSTPPVENLPLKEAIAAFAVAPEQATYLDVVRNCLQGRLLLDSTGSDHPVQGEDGVWSYPEGSTLQFAAGTGPDGSPALFAFTSQDEVARMHTDAPHDVQSFVQSAADVLRLAADERYGWLYIDPAGPTCAIANRDAEFALRGERNDAVKEALNTEDAVERRAAVLAALEQEGPLLLAIDAESMPEGGVSDGSPVRIRTSVDAEDNTVLLAFTSGPEVSARDVRDAFATRPALEIVRDALEPAYSGLVINPAGPWIALSRAELEAVVESAAR